AILTIYISLSVTKGKPKNFSLFLYIVLRLARLLPQLMIFILLTFLLPLLGSGPLWAEVVGSNVDKCETNWWLNLLLIQNLYKSDQMCAVHTWYIALDFQYHVMTAIVLLAYLYNKKAGIILNTIIIVIFLIISSIMIYVYEVPPAIIHTSRTYFGNLYHKLPPSYGVMKPTFNITKSSLTILWIAILAAYCIPLWDKVYWSFGRPFSPAFATVFYTLCRVIWTVCTSLMIWLCISGKGGLINTFLSHRAFVPMARLT
ncbi:unnamed protein product, partial [Medioppia subpectinata]